MSDEDRMVTSDEEADEDEDEDEEHGFDMANFMFGNVDSDGQLEADFLDEVWLDCCPLVALSRVGTSDSTAVNAMARSAGG